MSPGMFLAVFGCPFLIACAVLAWAVTRIERGVLALGVGLGGWAVITVTMALLSYNLCPGC